MNKTARAKEIGMLVMASVLMTIARLVFGVTATPEEMTESERWCAAKLDAVVKEPQSVVGLQVTTNLGGRCRAYSTDPLFSFIYDGKPSREFIGNWVSQRKVRNLDGNRSEHEAIYTDPKTGLAVRCVAVAYRDFPVVEWVVHLTNTGKTDTPIIEAIQAMDGVLPLPSVDAVAVNWANGAWVDQPSMRKEFAPQVSQLNAKSKTLRLSPGWGRSSDVVLPFFNVTEADSNGVVVAVGWSGAWAADFTIDPGGVLLKSGMASTHLVLRPGETIRTPRILLLFYKGDRWRGQNLLRQFILAHHRPLSNGQPLAGCISWLTWGMTPAEKHLYNINKIIENQLPMDYYWIDAGWHGHCDTNGSYSYSHNFGDWDVREKLYPDGFKPISNRLKQSGKKLLLWFAPEVVIKGTPWYTNHRDWVLDINDKGDYGSYLLMNLGNPECRKFITDFISAKINDFGLDCYRQDAFGDYDQPCWRHADTPDRQGITEIRYVEGLYAFWDELLARHSRLIIDNCSSGASRHDLETISRSTVFWTSDAPYNPVTHQCHTYGLMAWAPLVASGAVKVEGDDYDFRSGMCTHLNVEWVFYKERFPTNFPFAWAKRALDDYVKLRHLYLGDYYPLTSYSAEEDCWMAWQLDRPDLGEGIVQAFRRSKCPYESARFPLRGLDAAAVYLITDLDSSSSTEITGRDLMETGLPVTMKTKPAAIIIKYKRNG